MGIYLEKTLIFLDNYLKSWFKPDHVAGGVARCSTYLFPMRSPGSHPPFRGFTLYAPPEIAHEQVKQKVEDSHRLFFEAALWMSHFFRLNWMRKGEPNG